MPCSNQPSAEKALSIVRSHWGIENQLHWVLDVVFNEDDCQVKDNRCAENLSRLRHIATNLLKRDKSTKVSMKNKRRKASWNDEYLYNLLNSKG
ncbi:ISAs1 family transposase [Marinibactrum halimedae]|uniref:ISAs1 family transposase n=1 Tax=Marinibactrum halimedae TaxID=1444977 RepID=UPI0039F6C594